MAFAICTDGATVIEMCIEVRTKLEERSLKLRDPILILHLQLSWL